MKQSVRLFVSILVVLGVIAAVQAQDAQATEILQRVNAARTAGGIHPLTMNAQLVAAAQRHSDDMAQGDFLSHTGSDGSEFWQRMQAAGYPMTAGAENVLFQGALDAAGAFDQWWNSDGHRANMMSADYVEIGIAWAVSASGRYYYTMVLGAREGFVLPQVVTPTPTSQPPSPIPPTLPPTAEPQPTLPPPPTFTPIPPSEPSQTASPIRVDIPTLTPTVPPPPATITLAPTIPPLPTVTPSGQVNFARMFSRIVAVVIEELFIGTHDPVVQVVPSPSRLTATPSAIVPTPVLPDIQLLYSPNGLTLINVSGGTLDLTGLLFSSSLGAMNVEVWDTEFLTRPLFAFPAGDCLQVWSVDIVNVPPVPGSCRFRHAWISVRNDQVFWSDSTAFTVSRGGTVMRVCEIAAGVCDVSLSAVVANVAPLGGGTGVATPRPTQVQTTNNNGLTLVYNADSFALVNTSGRILDLSPLVFESDSGVLAAERWNTEFLTQPLTSFSSGGCLQVWAIGTPEILPPPALCEQRHAWIAVNESGRFWIGANTFRVRLGSNMLGTCTASAGVCDVPMP